MILSDSFDFFPLWNSLRVTGVAIVLIFFLGLLLGYYVSKLPRLAKGILDVILTLPLVLPPTVIGYILVKCLSNKTPIGSFLRDIGFSLFMDWKGAVVASVIVAFPLMYRTVRGAFEAFDENLADAGKTLGLSNTYIFWRIRVPEIKSGLIAGTVLAFARALGEYGATMMFAGATMGETMTISTTVYHYWISNEDTLAIIWVCINIFISAIVLLSINLFEKKRRTK